MSDYTKILGFDIYNKGIKNLIEHELTWDNKQVVISGNPAILDMGLNDTELGERFKARNSIIIPDGIGTVAVSRIRKLPMKEKIAGIEVLKAMLKQAGERDKTVYLLGAEKKVLEDAVLNIKTSDPNINIVGYRDGYFKDDNEVIQELKRCSPDLLVVALGCPRQEKFIYDNYDKLEFEIAMGVGGSLDILGGKINRAPKWMIKIGIEWVYRVIKEPFRFKRLGVIPKFMLKGIREKRND